MIAITLKASRPVRTPTWYPFMALKKSNKDAILNISTSSGAAKITLQIQGLKINRAIEHNDPVASAIILDNPIILPALLGF